MKRIALVLIFLGMVFVPREQVFAQDDTLPAYCELDYILEELMLHIGNVERLEDLAPVVEFVLTTITECAEPVLNRLVEALLGVSVEEGGVIEPTVNFDPNDGVMTGDEAEYVVYSVFSGDIAIANQYLCADEQIDEDEFDVLGEVTVDYVTCREGENAVTCDYSVTFQLGSNDASPLEDSTTFEIVEGKLCNSRAE